MWNDSKNDTIPGYRFAIALSFYIGCIWVQNGCSRVQTEARWVQHRAFVLLLAVLPTFALYRVLGLSGAFSSTESLKSEHATNRGVCEQDKTFPTRLRNYVGGLNDGVISVIVLRKQPHHRSSLRQPFLCPGQSHDSDLHRNGIRSGCRQTPSPAVCAA